MDLQELQYSGVEFLTGFPLTAKGKIKTQELKKFAKELYEIKLKNLS